LSALFIASEFAFKAAFAVVFVVSTDNESVTLSGFTIACAFPITKSVLLLLLLTL
jgi:hypothetical protein